MKNASTGAPCWGENPGDQGIHTTFRDNSVTNFDLSHCSWVRIDLIRTTACISASISQWIASSSSIPRSFSCSPRNGIQTRSSSIIPPLRSSAESGPPRHERDPISSTLLPSRSTMRQGFTGEMRNHGRNRGAETMRKSVRGPEREIILLFFAWSRALPAAPGMPDPSAPSAGQRERERG